MRPGEELLHIFRIGHLLTGHRLPYIAQALLAVLDNTFQQSPEYLPVVLPAHVQSVAGRGMEKV